MVQLYTMSTLQTRIMYCIIWFMEAIILSTTDTIIILGCETIAALSMSKLRDNVLLEFSVVLIIIIIITLCIIITRRDETRDDTPVNVIADSIRKVFSLPFVTACSLQA